MASFKKTYDTDSIVLRRIFAVDPDTNGRISANTILVIGPNGVGSFQDVFGFLSTISVPTSIVGGTGISITSQHGNYTIATSSIGVNDLQSTMNSLGSLGYNSTILVAGTNITFSSNGNQIRIDGQAGGGSIGTDDLTSTIKGLASIGYVSSLNTISSVNLSSGSLFASFLSSQKITASSITANKFVGDGSLLTNVPGTGGISASDFTSSLIGLGTLGYVSSSAELRSSLKGLGTLGYVSSFTTISSINLSSGSVFASYLSSQQIIASSITANRFVGDGSLLTNLPGGGGGIAAADLTSSLIGLGSMRYISTFNNLSTFSTNLSLSLYTLAAVISSLTVSSLTFGSGGGYLSFPDMRALSLSTVVIYGSSITATKFVGDGSLLTNIGITLANLTSSIQGLGTFGYLSSSAELISSPQLTSSLKGLGTLGYISSVTLTSTIQGLGTLGYISTPQLRSSLIGLGSMAYLSSFNTLSSLNISSGSLFTGIVSTSETNAGRLNFGTLYNNGVQLIDANGNFLFSFQTL
jgi:hypothetical protein